MPCLPDGGVLNLQVERLVEVEADLHPGEPLILSFPDRPLQLSDVVLRPQNLRETAADKLAAITPHQILKFIIKLNRH